MSKTLHLLYFARLREERGLSAETVQTSAATVAALYAELQQRHGFTLAPGSLRAAVNERFCAWDVPLAGGETVAFIQPVAGG